MATITIDQVQAWINTSDNSFAQSLRQQQQRGRVLSERQLEVATRIAAEQAAAPQARRSPSTKHYGLPGGNYLAKLKVTTQYRSARGLLVTKLVAVGDEDAELVVFGSDGEDLETGWYEFNVSSHDDYKGRKSTIIRRLKWSSHHQWDVGNAAEEQLFEAQAALARFTRPVKQTPTVKPAIDPASKTPFADYAKLLRGGK